MLKKIHQTIAIVILIVFVITSVKSPAYAQGTVDLALHLPQPGVMIHLSSEFTPAHLQGITIHPDNALQFDFLIHRGDLELDNEQKKEEYTKLVKYFLASLTIPDEDQWVNLSPYENNRIIKDDFGKTEMGRDLLAEDYMLKQITSSLIYPEDSLGKKFWTKIYARAWSEYHTTNIPVNTFNKVWIVPDQAIVYESGNTAYILKSHLKVMLEEDYLSLQKHSAIPLGQPGDMFKSELQRTCPQAGCQATQPLNVKAPQGNTLNASPSTHTIASQVIREVILPELEKEVNEGRNFANLRQMYSGMILATWYKTALKESLLGKVYADKAKVKGVDQDPKANTLIYQRYLKAFKKGVFNYIKEDMDRYTNEEIPRKYFSGGWQGLRGAQYYQRGNIPVGEVVIMTSRTLVRRGVDSAALSLGENTLDKATITINPERNIGAIGPSQHELRPVNDAAMRADRLRTLVLAAVPVVLVASMGLPYAIYLWKTHNLSEEASKNPKHIAYLPLETGT